MVGTAGPESEPVRVSIDAARSIGAWRPIWNWFGYDEPNYSYMPHGKKLLAQLAELHDGPVYVRAHNLLTSGDGTAALKWGSTNAYSETSTGNPIYNWDILDRIFDAYSEAGITPFVQVGFMPEALTNGPSPYRHDFPRTGITTGWAYPPKNLRRWTDLVAAWTRHMVERYGMDRVAAWPWEVWNEPDGLYWCGTLEAFCELFDATAAAIRSVIPAARIGGPHTCGPGASPRAAEFLRGFLARHARGGEGVARLDFIAFHAKGKPTIANGGVRMGLARHLGDIVAGLAIVREFPQFRDLPIILGESDPEGCAACPARTHPENAYRDGPLYGVYLVEALQRTLEIAARDRAMIEGSVTWAFEFEGEPFFAGYRELATNGIAKPVLNALRMLGKLRGERLAATSSAALPLERVLAEGVRSSPDIDVIATRDGNEIAVLAWHYHDDQLSAAHSRRVELTIEGFSPATAPRCEHFRMDERHSNAHALWLAQGSPDVPSAEQYAALEAASHLERLDDLIPVDDHALRLAFDLPRHAVSLMILRSRGR